MVYESKYVQAIVMVVSRRCTVSCLQHLPSFTKRVERNRGSKYMIRNCCFCSKDDKPRYSAFMPIALT